MSRHAAGTMTKTMNRELEGLDAVCNQDTDDWRYRTGIEFFVLGDAIAAPPAAS